MRSPQEVTSWYKSVVRDRLQQHAIAISQDATVSLFLLAAYAEAISRRGSAEDVLEHDLKEAHDSNQPYGASCLTGRDLLFFPQIPREKQLHCCPWCRALLNAIK